MKKSQPLAPKGGNDKVYTPPKLAKDIILHFNPIGNILEPCRGTGSFLHNLPVGTDWCELDAGRDFLTYKFDKHYDWVVTNPPWSQFRPFLQRSMEVSDNAVFLCLVNAIFMKARMRDMKAMGFGIAEILCVETPDKPWPQTGFQLGAIHIKRGYVGNIILSSL